MHRVVEEMSVCQHISKEEHVIMSHHIHLMKKGSSEAKQLAFTSRKLYGRDLQHTATLQQHLHQP